MITSESTYSFIRRRRGAHSLFHLWLLLVLAIVRPSLGAAFGSDPLARALDRLTVPLSWEEYDLPLSGRQATPLPLVRRVESDCLSLACRPLTVGATRHNVLADLEWNALSLMTPSERWSEVVAAASPAEKYDLSVLDFSFSLSRALQARDPNPVESRISLYRRAWASASLSLAPVLHPVTLASRFGVEVVWSPADLEALFVYHGMTSEFPVVRVSGDPFVDPMQLHGFVTHRLGRSSKGLVVEWDTPTGQQSRLVVAYVSEVLSTVSVEDGFSVDQLRTTLETAGPFGPEPPLVLQYSLRFKASVEHPDQRTLVSGDWTSGERFTRLWVPAPDGRLSSDVEQLANDRLGEIGKPQFTRWAAAASRQQKVLCAVATRLYRAATDRDDYPCEAQSSTTP